MAESVRLAGCLVRRAASRIVLRALELDYLHRDPADRLLRLAVNDRTRIDARFLVGFHVNMHNGGTVQHLYVLVDSEIGTALRTMQD
jgi:hypothetical protein